MPWYGSGTLNVAANGTNATGTGTQFLGNVRVGDGIAIQGSSSLHEVTGVTSDTQLTFAPPYAGTAGGGKAYRVAPVLGYDKDLSDAFNALRLQFGDDLSSLAPWATASTGGEAMDEMGFGATGKAVAEAATPAEARVALELGTAATADLTTSNTDSTVGRVLKVGDGGWLGQGAPQSEPYGYPTSINDATNQTRVIRSQPADNGVAAFSSGIHFAANDTWGRVRVTHDSPRAWLQGGHSGLGIGWTEEILTTGNTTIDTNGFIKQASPIIKLHSDRIELSSEGGPTFERVDTGHYQLNGCNGLRLDDGWYIETPHDRNKVPYFNVEWEQDSTPETDTGVLEEPADVTLTIRCYKRVWNPQTGQYDNGDPVDIPEGRWIDLRLNEVRQPEPEIPHDDEI